jgi:hypothetical protein
MGQHVLLQDPPTFTQIWIFGSKTNHLATLISPVKKLNRKSVFHCWRKYNESAATLIAENPFYQPSFSSSGQALKKLIPAYIR